MPKSSARAPATDCCQRESQPQQETKADQNAENADKSVRAVGHYHVSQGRIGLLLAVITEDGEALDDRSRSRRREAAKAIGRFRTNRRAFPCGHGCQTRDTPAGKTGGADVQKECVAWSRCWESLELISPDCTANAVSTATRPSSIAGVREKRRSEVISRMGRLRCRDWRKVPVLEVESASGRN